MAVTSASLHTIGVVGAGAMGAGIAQVGLSAGLNVILFDLDQAALPRAREQIRGHIARMVEKGRAEPGVLDQLDQRLQLAAQLTAMAPAQVVIEAIVERLEPKRELFAELEGIVEADALLATNTSSLPVSAIARNCQRRERVCGMHFFNPVPLMQLVEVIGTADTSEATFAAALALAERIGKTAVRVRDVPGFLVNLLGRAYVTEALHARQENVASEALIDEIMREAAGFRMGPFELMDLTGIDVNFPATSFIYQGFQHDPRIKTTFLHESLYNAGRFGRKSGQGFHRYGAAAPAPEQVPADADTAGAALSVFAAEAASGFAQLERDGLAFVGESEADAILISPRGEDAASACVRLGLHPERVVAVDCLGIDKRFITLMAPLGGCGVIELVATALRSLGYRVAVIRDSPGFIAPRLLAMVANLGCEVAQIGVAESPEAIDLAMKLAQNYPRGPLEWAAHLGPQNVLETLQELQAVTGSDRYRPSLWLRRRAQLQLPIHTPD